MSSKITFTGLYHITVDYTKSLSVMIMAGNYNLTDERVNEKNFTISGEGSINAEIELATVSEQMDGKLVVKNLKKHGYRPAKLEELLALGAQYSDLQRQFKIYTYRGRYAFSLFAIGPTRLFMMPDASYSFLRVHLTNHSRLAVVKVQNA